MPLGEEWNASNVVKNTTAPDIKTRAGRLIEPIKISKKRKNNDEDTSKKKSFVGSEKKSKK
jgi:hypothetical protein